MEDVFKDLFQCSWGDIRIWCTSLEWDAGNTQVKHDLSTGDDHPIQPRGRQLRRATAHVIFDDFPGEDIRGVTAFREFDATTRERRIFTHPLDGSFFARIGDVTPMLNESSNLSATVEFLPDSKINPVRPSGIGSSGFSGEAAMAQATDKMSKTLSDAGIGFPVANIAKMDFTLKVRVNIKIAFKVNLSASADFSSNLSASASGAATADASVAASVSASASAAANASAFAFASVYASAMAEAQVSAVAEASAMADARAFAFAYASAAFDADAKATARAWQDQDVTPRRIQVDAARLSDSLETMIDEGKFEEDLRLYPAFRQAILLGGTLRQNVTAATARSRDNFIMRIQTPTSLLSLCAKIYGGADAQRTAAEVAELNDIRTPGWMDPGDYLMPARIGASQPFLVT